MLTRLVVPLLAVTLLPLCSAAQNARYQPAYADPHGPELVMAYVSSTWCIGNRAPGLHQAVDSVKLLLASWAQAHGMTFRAVGVAIDWQPDSGLAYLREFGQFEELVVGSNWLNLGATALIWSDTAAYAGLPQVFVYRRDLAVGKTRITIPPPVILKRVAGGDKIVQWARAGAPIP